MGCGWGRGVRVAAGVCVGRGSDGNGTYATGVISCVHSLIEI